MKISEIRKHGLGEGLITRVYLESSFPIVKLLVNTSITPNMVSYFNIGIAFIAPIFFLTNHYFVGILFLFLSVVFDSVDGTLARIKKIFSPYGSFLDYLGSKILVPFTLIAIGINEDLFLISLIPAFLYILAYYPKMLEIQPKERIFTDYYAGKYFTIFVIITVIVSSFFYHSFVVFFIAMSIIYLSSINKSIFSITEIKQGIEKQIKKVRRRKNSE